MPFMPAVTLFNVSVVLVAPPRLVNPVPVSTCHCTVGVGVPVAAEVKVAFAPAATVWLTGSRVTFGGVVGGGVPPRSE